MASLRAPCIFPGKCLSTTHGDDCITKLLRDGPPKLPCAFCRTPTTSNISRDSKLVPCCGRCFFSQADLSPSTQPAPAGKTRSRCDSCGKTSPTDPDTNICPNCGAFALVPA